MVTINAIRKPIEAQIAEFDEFVKQNFSAKDGLIAEMLEYVLSSRGKGIRPILVMLSAAMNSSNEGRFGKRTLLAAMLVEMIHVASLIHDDVIDESDMRRGRASVNSRWQSRNAVLVGDYILAKTMALGMASAQYDIVSYVGSAMATLCEGEILQSQHARDLDTTRDDYFDIIYQKTASLLGVCAALGALSVGASREDIDRMRKYGEALGIAFQIQDDILDYNRNNNTGKPANNDLREHKITLPMIEVMESKSEEEIKEMKELLKRCKDDEAALDQLHNIVLDGGGIERATEVMQAYLSRAMHLVSKYEDTPYRKALIDLCTFVAERDK